MQKYFNNKNNLQCLQLQINMKGTHAHKRTYTKIHANLCVAEQQRRIWYHKKKIEKKKRKEIASLLILPTFTEPPEPLSA